MAVEAELLDDRVLIRLSGWDCVLNWRSKVEISRTKIESATALDRKSLESLIDHRKSGRGTHDGANRPNRRRIGTMLGRGVTGDQFWAVPAGPGTARLLVLNLRDHEFTRVVIAIDEVSEVVAEVNATIASTEAEQESST